MSHGFLRKLGSYLLCALDQDDIVVYGCVMLISDAHVTQALLHPLCY